MLQVYLYFRKSRFGRGVTIVIRVIVVIIVAVVVVVEDLGFEETW
jgi:hypothetical protein